MERTTTSDESGSHLQDGRPSAPPTTAQRLQGLLRRREKKRPGSKVAFEGASDPGRAHSGADDGKEEEEEDKKQKKADWRTHAILKPVKPVLDALEAWIRRCLPWRALKPILRSALLMELALIFLLIDPVERMMGQASFLILISALISPAELPLAMTIEREIFNVGLVLLGWAWACLGLKLAHLARDHPLPPSQVDYALLYHGEYLEAKSSAVMAAFLALGSAFFLYIKVALGPSPYLFGSIFGAILMTIST
ncbi:hypothetical protein OC834_001520, partial [Tilletia horrida]